MKSLIYALKMGWQYRPLLKKYLEIQRLAVESVLLLDPNVLLVQGVKCIAIDFDGVLGVYGATFPSEKLFEWLNSCVAHFGEKRVFIWSNRPSQDRIDYFAKHFPNISILQAVKKKPNPEGILQIVDQSGVLAADILVLDDRLLTGILAAEMAGARACWITAPLISLRGPYLIQELFFIGLRLLERLWIKWF